MVMKLHHHCCHGESLHDKSYSSHLENNKPHWTGKIKHFGKKHGKMEKHFHKMQHKMEKHMHKMNICGDKHKLKHPHHLMKHLGTPILADDEKFVVTQNVRMYKPEDITVKVVGNMVVVDCKHDEREEEYSLVSRHIIRKYKVPRDYDLEVVISEITEDGVLKIRVPKKQIIEEVEERIIPVIQIGNPNTEEIQA